MDLQNQPTQQQFIEFNKSEDYYYYRQSEHVYFYGLSVIIPFGLIGNSFSVLVFLTSSILRNTTTGQWLVALAIADSTVLIGDMMRWFSFYEYNEHDISKYYFPKSYGLNFLHTSGPACKLITFIRYASNLWSAWITVAIALERLIAVMWPLKIGHISTITRTRVLITFIVIVGIGLGIFPLWTVDIGTDNYGELRCTTSETYHTWNKVVIGFGTILIPILLIAVMTIATVVALYRARKLRLSHLAVSINDKRECPSKHRISVEIQLTVMLVAVCVATTALRSPYTIAYSVRSAVLQMKGDNNTIDKETDMRTYAACRMTDMINTINFAINFILYCFCGSSFRKQIKRLFLHLSSVAQMSPGTVQYAT